MPRIVPTFRLRVLAVASALALALAVVLAGSISTRAQDATASPSASGCAKASTKKGDPAGTPAADAKCVSVGAHDIYFDANLITIPADTDVKFELHNEGAALHTFVINDHENDDVKNLNIKESLDPGSTKEITINAPAGTYYFWCDIPGHEAAGMWGILKVEDGGHISAQSVDNPKEA
jgi:uncharacterized cupredoxin-like copper-binding protein